MIERVLMKGNEAVSEAAIQAGCRHFFGYPITPQNEVAAYMSARMPEVKGTYLQAESEVAAVNMVLGAAASGVRAMTSSSSPGISLKGEGISYLAGSDLPCLILNVQRGGPGLGSIQPAQQDYYQATKAPGHGGFRVLVFAPNSVQEMVDMAFYAFDMAEKYLMPAMLLTDGVLGQMMEPVTFPKIDIKPSDKTWAVGPAKGKKGKNFITSIYLVPEELEAMVQARHARYAQIERELPQAETYLTEDADIVVIGYGISARIARSAVTNARKEGIKAGLIRPKTLWPFPNAIIKEAAKNAKTILVTELSLGQMIDDVRLAVECKIPVEFFGRTGGVITSPAEVLNEIKKIVGGTK
jgi:2-oxoglutarate ferredoxin oxidoreductase subunit alpha